MNSRGEQTPLVPCQEHGDRLCYVCPMTGRHTPHRECLCGSTADVSCPVTSHRDSAQAAIRMKLRRRRK